MKHGVHTELYHCCITSYSPCSFPKLITYLQHFYLDNMRQLNFVKLFDKWLHILTWYRSLSDFAFVIFGLTQLEHVSSFRFTTLSLVVFFGVWLHLLLSLFTFIFHTLLSCLFKSFNFWRHSFQSCIFNSCIFHHPAFFSYPYFQSPHKFQPPPTLLSKHITSHMCL